MSNRNDYGDYDDDGFESRRREYAPRARRSYTRDYDHDRGYRHVEAHYASPAVGALPGLLKRVSWGAIFAGAVTALATMVLLSLLGLSIGAGMIDPAYDENPLSGMGAGTIIWFALSSMAALFAGGYVAGRFAGLPNTQSSVLHGAVVWAIATAFLSYAGTSATGSLISGAAGTVQQAAQMSATAISNTFAATGDLVQQAQQAVPDQLPPSVRSALERRDLTVKDARQKMIDLLNKAGLGREDLQQAQVAARQLASDIRNSPSDAGQDVRQFVDKLFGGPDAVISDQERKQAIQLIQRKTGVSPQEAERQLEQIQAELNDARQALVAQLEDVQKTAVQTAETAMNTLTQAAFGAFIASLLGLFAAAGGAAFGSPNYARVYADDDDDDDDDY